MRSTVAIPVSGAKVAEIRALKWTILSRDRSLPHLGRKLYHMLCGLGCFSLYAFVLDRSQALWTLGIIGGVWVALDFLRLRWSKLNSLALKYFGAVMRREELNRLAANTYYIIGMFVVVLVFPKPIALLSVLFLAVGDPVAAVVGTAYGRRRIVGKKSLEGALANFSVSFLITFAFAMSYLEMSFATALLLALGGGVASVLAELAPAPVDDNFSIPVLSGLMLTALFMLFA